MAPTAEECKIKGNDAFKIIALAFFLFGLVLFVVLCAWAIARCVMFPKVVSFTSSVAFSLTCFTNRRER